MTTAIHCHLCGGVIHDPATIEYHPPRASAQLALTRADPCTPAPAPRPSCTSIRRSIPTKARHPNPSARVPARSRA